MLPVRAASPDDLEALVQLRLENGRVHALLNPSAHRVPSAEQVREHFAARLAEKAPQSAVLVACVDGAVLGSAEVALDPPTPGHQILRPLLTAHVHLVVAEHARTMGVGRNLEAAEVWATDRVVRQLVAGIQAYNRPALRFYRCRGYRDNGMVRIKDLPGPSH